MPWEITAAAVAASAIGHLKPAKIERLYMKNWRVINNNMIQTYNKHVWLWDNKGGVAVLAPVPSRPWKKVNEDFTHWMAGNEGEAAPTFIPEDKDVYVAKEHAEEMLASAFAITPLF